MTAVDFLLTQMPHFTTILAIQGGRPMSRQIFQRILFVVTVLALLSSSGQLRAQSRLDLLQADGWVEVVLSHYGTPDKPRAKLDDLDTEIEGSSLSKAAKQALHDQVDSLRKPVETLAKENGESVTKIRQLARMVSDLYASRKSPKLDGPVEIDLAAEFSRLSEEDLRKAPYLELIVALHDLNSGLGKLHHLEVCKRISRVSEVLSRPETPRGPFVDSQIIWRSRFMSDIKGDLNGAIALLEKKADALEPFSELGFGYGTVRSEQALLALMSGQRAPFVEGANAIHVMFKIRKERGQQVASDREFLIVVAPSYQRLLMQGKQCVQTLEQLKTMIAKESDTRAQAHFYDTFYLSAALSFATDLGETSIATQEALARLVESRLTEKTNWTPSDYETAMQLILWLYVEGHDDQAEGFMKSRVKAVAGNEEVIPLDQEGIRTFRFLTENVDDADLTQEMGDVLNQRDNRFGSPGTSSARTRLIFLLSRHSEKIDVQRRIRLLNECAAGIRQGMTPNGAMERKVLLRIAEAAAKEKGDAAQLQAIQEKAKQELTKSEQYRADLVSALEKIGGVELLTSPIEQREAREDKIQSLPR